MPQPEPERVVGPGARAIDVRVERADGAPPDARYHPRAPHRFRGPGPVEEVTTTRVGGHWHLVTYGLSELDEKESDDRNVSGWGFELTFRLAGPPDPPFWAVDLLANLAAYVWSSRHAFAPGHHVALSGPIKLDAASAIHAAVVVTDPALGVIRGPFGSVEFLQVVGVTADELELCRSWSTEGVIELLARRDPLLVTDLERASVLDDPGVAAEVRRRAAADGSSLTELRVARLRWGRRMRRTTVELGAGTSAALGPALRRELIGEGASFRVVGDRGELCFTVAGTAAWQADTDRLEIDVPLEEVRDLAALFDGRTGWGRRPAWPALGWHVVP